ncbi:MAG: hypothetical protein K5872_06655 [Rhizobiaceae bacterium]|nr:hypothetical protein [Rhizobiaceae bacterium]MCV0405893.1 hypothetical protein [Rhizobiaceae bacterium]
MRRKLADGEVRAAAVLGDGTLAPVRPASWAVDENFNAWFTSCQITNFDLFGSGVHPLAGVTHFWLFIERAGLDAILSPHLGPQRDQAKAERPKSRLRSYPHQKRLDDALARPFLFLGEAIDWILSQGNEIETECACKNWDEAERKFFDQIDADGPKVTGYQADRVYRELPTGIWARMNKGGSRDPAFSPIDESEEREDGGTVWVGDSMWEGVRVPTAFVLEHWSADHVGAGNNKGGAPAKADWPAIEEAFQREVQERGLPDALNEHGWQRQADVERWIADILVREGVEVSETTRKNYARQFLHGARGQ